MFQASIGEPVDVVTGLYVSYRERTMSSWALIATDPTLTLPKDQRPLGSNIYHILRPKTRPFSASGP